jgi:hypothetical protein
MLSDDQHRDGCLRGQLGGDAAEQCCARPAASTADREEIGVGSRRVLEQSTRGGAY